MKRVVLGMIAIWSLMMVEQLDGQTQGSNLGRVAMSMGVRKVAAFLTTEYEDGDVARAVRGTCFFVVFPDKRLGDGGEFVYLATNAHMAAPTRDGRALHVKRAIVRLNLRSPSSGVQFEDVELPILRWQFPTDPAVDLAVMPLAPDENRYDIVPVSPDMFATRDVVEKEGLGEGDRVLFAGYFYQFPGLRRNQPVIREGVLAMTPDDQMPTTTGRPGFLYLADVHVFGGNSGAPMFISVSGLRAGTFLASAVPLRLLGVVSGYMYEEQDLKLRAATTLEGKANANSGISTVVPVDELVKLLNSPALQSLRDQAVSMKQSTKSR